MDPSNTSFQQENWPAKYQVSPAAILSSFDYDDDAEEEDGGEDDQEGEDEGRKMTGGWWGFQITNSQRHGGRKQIIFSWPRDKPWIGHTQVGQRKTDTLLIGHCVISDIMFSSLTSFTLSPSMCLVWMVKVYWVQGCRPDILYVVSSLSGWSWIELQVFSTSDLDPEES